MNVKEKQINFLYIFSMLAQLLVRFIIVLILGIVSDYAMGWVTNKYLLFGWIDSSRILFHLSLHYLYFRDFILVYLSRIII